MKNKAFLFLILLSINNVWANVSLPSIFSDNMVLQRNVKIPVWGFDVPNKKVTVKFHKQTKNTVSDTNGKWTVYLDNENASFPLSYH